MNNKALGLAALAVLVGGGLYMKNQQDKADCAVPMADSLGRKWTVLKPGCGGVNGELVNLWTADSLVKSGLFVSGKTLAELQQAMSTAQITA